MLKNFRLIFNLPVLAFELLCGETRGGEVIMIRLEKNSLSLDLADE